MNPTQYRDLVGSLEAIARTDKPALRRRVMRLVALGYGYVLGVVLIMLLAIIATIAIAAAGRGLVVMIKLLIALVIAEWLILKSLWVKTEAPQGFSLGPGVAPALDRRVEEIRSALEAPRADEVLLTTDFNASVTQIPRLGIFGFPRTYLVLGVPLMAALEPKQLDAVLAHEFAHLSGSHPKRGLWIYRISATWQQLGMQLHQSRNWARILFERFITWYSPRLRAYGFVMSRADEYAADADAAKIAGADAMGAALVAMELRGRNLGEHFWPDVWKRVETEQTPPTGAWLQIPTVAMQDPPAPVRDRWLGTALTRHALDDDTHPSIRERLLALGVVDSSQLSAASVASRLVAPLKQSSAQHYLGSLTDSLLATIDAQWTAGVAEGWRHRHEELKSIRQQSNTLIERERSGESLTVEERWQLAWTISELEGDIAAKPYLRRVLEAGEHPLAHFVLGRALLAENDVEGVEHIKAAMAQSVESVPVGSAMLRQFSAERGDSGGILDAEVIQHEHGEQMQRAMAERADVFKHDTLVPADLIPEDLEKLRQIAAARSEVSEMWIARKVTQLLRETPMYVVVVEPRWWQLGMRTSSDRKLVTGLLESITLSVNCHLYVIARSGHIGWLVKKMKKVPGSHIYSRR